MSKANPFENPSIIWDENGNLINPFENDEEFDSRPDIRQMTEAEAIRVIEETQHGRIIERYNDEEGGDQRREKVLAAIQKRWEWLFAKGLHFRGPYGS